MTAQETNLKNHISNVGISVGTTDTVAKAAIGLKTVSHISDEDKAAAVLRGLEASHGKHSAKEIHDLAIQGIKNTLEGHKVSTADLEALANLTVHLHNKKVSYERG